MTEHEVVTLFKERVFPLSKKLTEMLNEHYSHQTERRGCGYTQVTRVLAEYVNVPRQHEEFLDFKLFENYEIKFLRKLFEQKKLYQLQLDDWHNLDCNEHVLAQVQQLEKSEFRTILEKELQFQQQLRDIRTFATKEESQLICDFFEDIILPKFAQTVGLVELTALQEKPKVGSCPMAENFFLKIAHRRVLREGLINIFVDENQNPILLEKLNMGDNHSCISLRPVIMNGIRLPAGSLFSVDYDIEKVESKRPNLEYKGYVIPYTAINGFWFLRLTTLAISPENRKRAFTTHYEQQVQNGLYSPDTTKLQQLIDIAMAQIG